MVSIEVIVTKLRVFIRHLLTLEGPNATSLTFGLV